MTGFTRTLRVLTVAAVPALLAAAAHITPTVVLKKQADVIRATLPDARSFFVTTVEIGRQDANRLKDLTGFKPEDPKFKFFYGKTSAGAVDGVVFFPQVNTQHGPFEVGLTVTPDGAIKQAVATKATVETKPWVQKAVAAGLMKRFAGLRLDDDPAVALRGVSKDELGAMPYYSAEMLTTAVKRGMALYRVLYEKQ